MEGNRHAGTSGHYSEISHTLFFRLKSCTAKCQVQLFVVKLFQLLLLLCAGELSSGNPYRGYDRGPCATSQVKQPGTAETLCQCYIQGL